VDGNERRKPRILIDAVAYSPQDGGLTTAMHDLLETCRRLTDFEFIIVHDRTHGAALRAFGLPTYSVAIPRMLRFFASLLLLPLVARRLKPDAVHCEMSALPWLLGVPGSLTVNDVYFLIDRRAGGRTLRQRVMQFYWAHVFVGSARRARVLKTISETTADDLRRLVSPKLDIVLCEPCVTSPSGPRSTRRAPAEGEELRLLFLGSVVPRRNLPFLLRALQHVRRDWRLDVAGSLWWGTEELSEMAVDERVHLLGYVPDGEREALIANAHLLIAPSRYEGFGYPVAEAMASGLPVFASDASAFREFVPDDWRFPLSDPFVVAAMIDGLDAASYATMLLAAPEAVRRFSRSNHADRHRQLFTKLLAERRE
jgi:alpha-1,3-rhamnosyl/mannosyltransferase